MKKKIQKFLVGGVAGVLMLASVVVVAFAASILAKPVLLDTIDDCHW